MNPKDAFGAIGSLASIVLFIIIAFFPELIINPRIKIRADQLKVYTYDTKTGEQTTPDTVKLSKTDFDFLMTGKK